MKRILITLYVLASVVLTAVAQARFTSNTEMYSFGQIEWKHPVTVQYTITNTGDQPLVLTEVEPDCACSVAQWTKTPIAPGAKGTVNVTFDAKALGHFHGFATNRQNLISRLRNKHPITFWQQQTKSVCHSAPLPLLQPT